MRYQAFQETLRNAVLDTPGATPVAQRRAVLERAMEAGATRDGLPSDLTAYVDTVTRHAYKVTDAHIAALRRAGYSDDAVFEITVATAVGAALHRLERGMAAMRGEEPD